MRLLSNVWKYKHGELFYSIPNSDRDKGFQCNKDHYTFMGTIEQEIKEPKRKMTLRGGLLINTKNNSAIFYNSITECYQLLQIPTDFIWRELEQSYEV